MKIDYEEAECTRTALASTIFMAVPFTRLYDHLLVPNSQLQAQPEDAIDDTLSLNSNEYANTET